MVPTRCFSNFCEISAYFLKSYFEQYLCGKKEAVTRRLSQLPYDYYFVKNEFVITFLLTVNRDNFLLQTIINHDKFCNLFFRCRYAEIVIRLPIRRCICMIETR